MARDDARSSRSRRSCSCCCSCWWPGCCAATPRSCAGSGLRDAARGPADGPPVPAPEAAPGARPGAPAPALAGPTPAGDAISLDFARRRRRADAAGLPDQRLRHLRRLLGDARRAPAARRRCAPWSSPTAPSASARPRLRELAPGGMPGGHVLAGLAGLRRARGARTSCSSTGRSAARGWRPPGTALSSLVGDAIEDAREAAAGRPRRAGGTARAHRVERTLAGGRHRPRAPEPVSRPTPRARRAGGRVTGSWRSGCWRRAVAAVRAAWSP